MLYSLLGVSPQNLPIPVKASRFGREGPRWPSRPQQAGRCWLLSLPQAPESPSDTFTNSQSLTQT